MSSFGCDLSLECVDLRAFGGEVVAQFRPEVGDRVACFGEQTDLEVEVVPHVVEPPVVEERRLRSGTGSFDLGGVGGDRIVTWGLRDMLVNRLAQATAAPTAVLSNRSRPSSTGSSRSIFESFW